MSGFGNVLLWRGPRRALATVSACLLLTSAALAAPDIDKRYIKSLAAPGKTVLVIEYYDGSGKVAARRGYVSRKGFTAVSPTDFRVDGKTALHLYGVEPCTGDMVNRSEDFTGSCKAFAEQQLQIMLRSPKVIFCRAFASEEEKACQDATCYGYYHYPGSLDSIDMFGEQLVSLGALRIAKAADGKPLRPDLEPAEKLAHQGHGMWADPRVTGQ